MPVTEPRHERIGRHITNLGQQAIERLVLESGPILNGKCA